MISEAMRGVAVIIEGFDYRNNKDKRAYDPAA